MKKVLLSVALGLTLVAFGANHAQAASPFCFDFSAFCDCLTVNIISDSADGKNTRRYTARWENQDCAGTTSNLSGGKHDNNYLAGELNSVLGLDGYNFNFTSAIAPTGGGTFDLNVQLLDGTDLKVQDEAAYSVVAGACPADCSAAAKPQGLPASSQR